MQLSIKSFLQSMDFKLILITAASVIFVVIFCIAFVKISKKNAKCKAELRELDYLTQIYNRGYFIKNVNCSYLLQILNIL